MTKEQKTLLAWIVDQHFRRSQEMYSRGVELLTENPKGMQPLSNRAFDAARRRLELDRMNALRMAQVVDDIEVTD